MNPYDPKQPTKNKPGTPAWWGEIFVRFLNFMVEGAREILGAFTGKK